MQNVYSLHGLEHRGIALTVSAAYDYQCSPQAFTVLGVLLQPSASDPH